MGHDHSIECGDYWLLATRLQRLASNLSTAAGLCEAFKQGTRWPYFLDADDLSDDYAWFDNGDVAKTFRPGHALPVTSEGEQMSKPDLIDELFYSTLIHKFEPEFCEAADRLGVSNEQLLEQANSNTPSAFRHLCGHALAHRRATQLVAMMMPGEQCVSLADLAAREAKAKGSA